MPKELKICGMKSESIIKKIIEKGGCKYLGFVFYSASPRNLSIERSKKLTSIVPNHIKKVAVLVKPKFNFVEKIKDDFDYLQVYETSPAESKELKKISGKKIIQAIKIKEKNDINLYKKYLGIVDNFLFDSPAMEKSSMFDWNHLRNIKINEWFLAGGISINNLEKASKISKKIDISSSLEDTPGVKSSKKVSDFLVKAKKL